MRFSTSLGYATAVGLCLAVPAQPSLAQVAASPYAAFVGRQAANTPAELAGFVSDENGKALAGAVVSAIGADSVFAVSDGDGHFLFRSLPQGPYVVRAHLQGYLPARGRLMQVTSTSARGPFRITLVKRAEPTDAPRVLAAGVGLVDETPATAPDPPEQHEHDELAWRLRHLRRSVLKEAGQIVPGRDHDDDNFFEGSLAGLGRAVGTPARVASSLFADIPVAGQFNILTTTSFDRPQDLFSPESSLAQGIAFLSLAAPGVHGEWRMRGTVTQGDLSSWLVAGSYLHQAPAAHEYEAGFSYGMQRYSGGNAEALAALRDGSRNVGALYAFDNWSVTPALRVDYGARYANYDYLRDESLLSPRMGVEVRPSARDSLRLRASVSRRETAPGAEEFMPPLVGVWLPPERTFSSLSRNGFSPERTEHTEVSAERQMPGAILVGVRAFRQRGEDQVVTLFGVPVSGGPSSTGHYRVGSAGDFDATGWGVSVSRNMGEATKASLDYELAGARWTRRSPDADALMLLAGQALRTVDHVHDLTATVESVLAPTSTRVFVLYRLNTAVAAPGVEQASAGGARFDVQVNQALPFLGFASARWEALVAVKNVFRDDASGGSVYDELLVVRAPTRVLGGVTVRF